MSSHTARLTSTPGEHGKRGSAAGREALPDHEPGSIGLDTTLLSSASSTHRCAADDIPGPRPPERAARLPRLPSPR